MVRIHNAINQKTCYAKLGPSSMKKRPLGFAARLIHGKKWVKKSRKKTVF